MDEDVKPKIRVRLPPTQMYISPETRERLMRGVMLSIATPEEKEAQIILPLPECLRRLHAMQDAILAKRGEPKPNVVVTSATGESKSLLATFLSLYGRRAVTQNSTVSEPMEDVKNFSPMDIKAQPIKYMRRLSQAVIDKMKSALSNMMPPSVVKRPSKKQLPPPSTAKKKKKNRGNVRNRRKAPIPQLGRPFPKRIVPTAKINVNCMTNTFRKPQFVETVGNGSTTDEKNLSVTEDISNDFGEFKLEPDDDTDVESVY